MGVVAGGKGRGKGEEGQGREEGGEEGRGWGGETRQMHR